MSKAKVAIVTDSTSNLSAELAAAHNLYVIPQILNWDGVSLKDGIDITPEAFYDRLAASPTVPTTSQPSAGEFLDFFKKVAEEADSIVAVLVSDGLSGTIGSARTAAGMMADYPIEIVDTRSVSMGLGLIAIAAAEAAKAGKDYHEVAAAARALVPFTKIVFVVDTLEFLHKGGRIGGAKRLVGSMLSMKPLLHLEDGKIAPLASIRTKKKAVSHLLDVVSADTAGKHLQAAIINANAQKEADAIFEQVQARMSPAQLTHCTLTPVVGTHAGPGTVGIAYIATEA